MVKQLETKLNSRALNGRDCGDDNKGAERGENEKEREGDIYLAEGNTPRSALLLAPAAAAVCSLRLVNRISSSLRLGGDAHLFGHEVAKGEIPTFSSTRHR